MYENRYPDRTGETYALQFSERHRWYYYPEMRREERVFDPETLIAPFDFCAYSLFVSRISAKPMSNLKFAVATVHVTPVYLLHRSYT